MIINLATLQHIIGQNVHRYETSAHATTIEIKEALCYFMKLIGNIEDQQKAQTEATAEQTEKTDIEVSSDAVDEVKPQEE